MKVAFINISPMECLHLEHDAEHLDSTETRGFPLPRQTNSQKVKRIRFEVNWSAPGWPQSPFPEECATEETLRSQLEFNFELFESCTSLRSALPMRAQPNQCWWAATHQSEWAVYAPHIRAGTCACCTRAAEPPSQQLRAGSCCCWYSCHLLPDQMPSTQIHRSIQIHKNTNLQIQKSYHPLPVRMPSTQIHR